MDFHLYHTPPSQCIQFWQSHYSEGEDALLPPSERGHKGTKARNEAGRVFSFLYHALGNLPDISQTGSI